MVMNPRLSNTIYNPWQTISLTQYILIVTLMIQSSRSEGDLHVNVDKERREILWHVLNLAHMDPRTSHGDI